MKFLCLWALASASFCSAGTLLEEADEVSCNLDYDISLADYEKALAADPENPELHGYSVYTLLYEVDLNISSPYRRQVRGHTG